MAGKAGAHDLPRGLPGSYAPRRGAGTRPGAYGLGGAILSDLLQPVSPDDQESFLCLHSFLEELDASFATLGNRLFYLAVPSTAVIVQAAQDKGTQCDLCSGALDLFVSILGAEAGNMALKVMATGGVYLAGGIPARIIPQLEEGPFQRAFMQKGRMSGLVEKMPVRVLSNPKSALLGAACHSMSTGPQDDAL